MKLKADKIRIYPAGLGSIPPLLGHNLLLQGTSQADMNGRRGVAVGFDKDTGRYIVEVRSLAADKLALLASTSSVSAAEYTVIPAQGDGEGEANED